VRAVGRSGQVAIASTQVAALVLAHARPGVTVVPSGAEAAALAAVPLDVLARLGDHMWPARATSGSTASTPREAARGASSQRADVPLATFKQWGLRTLGELAAMPPAELAARLGRPALLWQQVARGEDLRPLVPTELEERFDAALDLEWPIEGLEPLSFVLTRLLEPLCTRLERRDRGAAGVHVTLDLVSREMHARSLQLPTPMRDVRTLRTLVLLDIEAHPPAGAIERVAIAIDPTPGRVLQHTLFTRALPTPERLSTLLARLGALMGQDRVGAPAVVDTFCPGAFDMRPFPTDHDTRSARAGSRDSTAPSTAPDVEPGSQPFDAGIRNPLSALRRCRQPVPARVAIEAGRPVRVTTDRRGFCGGTVVSASGPWRTSGHWWAGAPETPIAEGGLPRLTSTGVSAAWNREEWEVALSDGAVYRVFQIDRRDSPGGRLSSGWFIDGVFD